MITFLDGPAEGQLMSLQRTPIMLRVVRSPSGICDALDLLTDEATAQEEIWVYRMDGVSLSGVVCSRNRRPGNRCDPLASYRLLPQQPADEHVRTTTAWQAWCEAVLFAEQTQGADHHD